MKEYKALDITVQSGVMQIAHFMKQNIYEKWKTTKTVI